MTVFICGSTGRLGRSVAKVFEQEAKVVAPTRQELDLRSKEEIQEAIEANQPSILINCAAWTDVDGCEKNPELAKEINATLPQQLSELSKKVGAHLVHITTDFVLMENNFFIKFNKFINTILIFVCCYILLISAWL